MKRCCALLLIAVLLFGLTACAESPDTVTFYYVRPDNTYQYAGEDSVIAGEVREVMGHSNDLQYLLALYFHGPTSETLRSPFPSGTLLQSVVMDEDALFIELSGIVSLMQGTNLTLACASLAKTCFGLSDVQTVTIFSEGLNLVSMTLDRDSLLLVDDSAAAAPENN